jgi:hypothetical protein
MQISACQALDKYIYLLHNPAMKKNQAIKKATSARKLAELLQISTSAVHQWGEFVPSTSLDKLKALRPEWFTKKVSDQ